MFYVFSEHSYFGFWHAIIFGITKHPESIRMIFLIRNLCLDCALLSDDKSLELSQFL